MVDKITRRRAIQLSGGAIGTTLAGCAGGGGQEDGSGDGGGDGGSDGGGGDGGGGQQKTTSQSDTGGAVQIAFASGYPADDPNYPTGLTGFADRLRKKSNQEIEVKLFPDAQQGSDQEIAQKVTAGSMQMGHISLSNLASFVKLVNVKNLPLLTPTVDAADQMLASKAWKDRVYPAYRKSRLEPLLEWTFDFRHLGVNPGVAQGGVKQPSDMQGVKIRVAGSDVTRKAFASLGANVVNIAWSEAPTAMKEGVFDAIHISRLAHCSYGFGQWEKFVSNPNLVSVMFTVFANNQWFKNLDKKHQQIIKEAAAEQRKENIKNRDKALEQAVECFTNDGAQYVTIDEKTRQKWVNEVGYKNSMWNSYVEQFPFTQEDVQALAQAARE